MNPAISAVQEASWALDALDPETLREDSDDANVRFMREQHNAQEPIITTPKKRSRK